MPIDLWDLLWHFTFPFLEKEKHGHFGLDIKSCFEGQGQGQPKIPKGPMFYDDEESEIVTISASVVENQDIELPGVPMPSSRVMNVQEFLIHGHSKKQKHRK